MKYLFRVFFISLLISSISFSQWIPQNSNTTHRLLTVFFLNDGLGWAGGNEGCIVRTTNGGTDWSYISIGTKYTVHAVSFIDSLKGWAALYAFRPSTGGYIAATTDGGISWQDMTYHNPSIQWIYGFDFLNQNIGWISNGYAGSLLKTTDGGFNWQNKYVPSSSRMMSIQFLNDNLAWAAGGNGHILKTTNGGDIWSLQYSGVSQELRDIDFVNENEGWVVGLDGVILHTTNGGTNWFLQGSNTSNDLFGVSFCNQTVGWVSGNQGLVLNTENGGGPPVPVELVSFTAYYNSGIVNLSWITATELNNSGFDVERKSETGNWDRITFIPGNETTTETKHYFFSDNVKSLSATVLTYRLKQIDIDGTFEYSNEIEVEINLPTRFQLAQNNPNPFNPVTLIKYQLPFKSSLTLKIFDILGKEVETLVNEEKDAGYYQISFDASSLSSGIYLYTLQTENYFITKK